MFTKNNYCLLAGLLNLATFLLHLFGGQLDLIDPMLSTDLALDKSAQLIGAWHMVSIMLLLSSLVFLSAGLGRKYANNTELLSLFVYLNLSFCLPFLLAGFYYQLFVPQWLLFLPIGLLSWFGLRKARERVT